MTKTMKTTMITTCNMQKIIPKTKTKKCHSWRHVKTERCKKCDNMSYHLTEKHEEHGDNTCLNCGMDTNWFYYCHMKCGTEKESVDGP